MGVERGFAAFVTSCKWRAKDVKGCERQVCASANRHEGRKAQRHTRWSLCFFVPWCPGGAAFRPHLHTLRFRESRRGGDRLSEKPPGRGLNRRVCERRKSARAIAPRPSARPDTTGP